LFEIKIKDSRSEHFKNIFMILRYSYLLYVGRI